MIENVSLDTAKNVLEDYKKKQMIIPPEGIELSVEEEQFLRGYVCGKNSKKEVLGNEGNAIRNQIINIRSKYCEPILELLAQEGELYHGDLAERLNISPSSLNVVIKKMQESSPAIIQVMQIGKYKIYTLPPSIREYIKNKNCVSSSLEKKNCVDDESLEVKNVLLCLQHFVENAGIKWKDKLNLLLQGIRDGVSEEVNNAFDILMKNIIAVSKHNEEEIKEIKSVLNNDILFYLLQCYIADIEECEEILEQISSKENGKRLLRHIKLQ